MQGYPSTGPPQNGQGYPPPIPGVQGYPPQGQPQPSYNPGQPGYPPPPGQPGYLPPLQPGYPPGQPPQGYQVTSPMGPPQQYPNVSGPSPQGGFPTSPMGYPQPQGYPGTSPMGTPQHYPNFSGSGPPPQGYPTSPMGQPLQYPQTQAEGANAPTASDMNRLPGYEGVSFDSTPSAPPPYNPDVIEEPTEEPTKINLPELKEEDVRDCLTTFASAHCCYGSNPAKHMEILEIKPQSSFHYTLETYTEKRETSWQFEPYDGKHVMNTGPAPAPWDVQVKYPSSFVSSKQTVEVPNTSDIRPCHDCMGLGRKRCKKCQGNCSVQCSWCNGKGKRIGDDVCDHCSGAGRKCCPNCSGNGHEGCKTCKERSKLRYYIRLQVTWTNYSSDKISETTTVPIKYIRKCTGETVFNEKRPRVAPISRFFDPAVVEASKELVANHLNSYKEERILEQRHNVRIIPISEISYRWKNTEGSFHIYGFENMIFFPDYPSKCCCGCCDCCIIL